MSHRWYFNSGDWNAICQSCGRKFKASQLHKRWDGLYVCEEDFEYRHPQDFLRSRADKIAPPWTSPRPADVFVPITFTEFPVDSALVEDSVSTAADFYRYVGQITYPTDVDVLNGSALNVLDINHTSVDVAPPTNDETITIAEDIVSSQGFGVSVSDSMTLTESLVESEGEFALDTMSMSEVVFAYTITNKLLNAHLVNEVTLG